MQQRQRNQRRQEQVSSRTILSKFRESQVYAGFFLIILSMIFVLSACGKKGAPVPPREKPPAAINDLKEKIQADQLTLTWTAPSLKKLAGFYVYRSKISAKLPDCKGCPVLFTRIASISLETVEDTSLFSYSETLEAGYNYIYKVTAYSTAGLVSNDSNTVEFTY